MQLSDFRLLAMRRIGAVSSLTADENGSTTVFRCAALHDEAPSGGVGQAVSINGETRIIVMADNADGLYALNRPLTNAVAADDDIFLYKRFSPAEIDVALGQAISDAWPYVAGDVVDETLTTVAQQYEYTIPATIYELERMSGGRVSIEVHPDQATYPFQRLTSWRVRDGKIVIDPDELIPGRILRVEGLGLIDAPVNDSDDIPYQQPEIDLLVFLTLANLFAKEQGTPNGDTQHAVAMEAKYRGLFEARKDVLGRVLEPEIMENISTRHRLDLPLAYFSTPGP